MHGKFKIPLKGHEFTNKNGKFNSDQTSLLFATRFFTLVYQNKGK